MSAPVRPAPRPAPSMVQTSLQHRDNAMHSMANRLARIEALATLALSEGGIATMVASLTDIRELARASAVGR